MGGVLWEEGWDKWNGRTEEKGKKEMDKHVIDNERGGRFLRLSPVEVCGNISGSVATDSG